MEVESTFEVMLEKPINYSVNSIYWSQTMDLITLITESNSLELFRMGEKAQKIFQLDQKQTITSIDFSPDSQYLVYGRLDGLVQIIRTENGEKVFFYENTEDKITKTKLLGVGGLESVLHEKNKHTRSTIEAIKWVDYLPQTSWEHLVPFTKQYKQNQLILSISPHPFCDKNSLIKIRHLTQNQTRFSLLLSSEKDNTFISLNGMILIATLNYSQVDIKDFYILHSTYHDRIYTVISHCLEERTNFYLVAFDCKEFNDHKEEIVKVNYLLAYVGELLTYIERSYKTVCAKVKEIVKSYNNKISVSAYDEEDCEVKQSEQMYRLLTLGVPTKPIQEWVSKDLHDTPYLQKMDENLTAMFSSLNELTLESTQNVVERLVIILKKLIEMSKLQLFQKLGLDSERLNKFYEQVKSLYKTGELLLIESTEAKLDIKNMLIWLNKLAIRAMNQVQTQTANMRSNLNKYTVDTSRLRDFLKDDSRFKLQNLLNLCFGNTAKATYKPSFKIYSSNSNTGKQYENKCNNYNQILSDLDLLSNKQNPEEQTKQHYQTIQAACREATYLWLDISKQPIQKLNNLIGQKVSTSLIGSVETNTNYLVKVHSFSNFMLVLYTDSEFATSLNWYNCLTGAKSQIRCPDSYYVADVSITSKLVLVLLRSLDESHGAFVGELNIESFDEGEMVFQKKMQVEGEVCQLASSEKGLSSILINKNKMIIIV